MNIRIRFTQPTRIGDELVEPGDDRDVAPYTAELLIRDGTAELAPNSISESSQEATV